MRCQCGCEDSYKNVYDIIDEVCDTLNGLGYLDVIDLADYLAKNLDQPTLAAFKGGLNRVKV